MEGFKAKNSCPWQEKRWLDGSDYKFGSFFSQQLQNFLNKNLSDTERCKGGEKCIQRNGKRKYIIRALAVLLI